MSFSIQGNRAPDLVQFGIPFVDACRAVVLPVDAALRVDVTPGPDPDGDALTIELEVLGDEDTGVFAAAAPALGASAVSFDVPTEDWRVGAALRFRARATDGDRTSPWTSCYASWGASTVP